jgi:bifunctional NMN adenylyltransferase/nudix hydrolase
MKYLYDLVVYIGRFQPKHKAHHANTLKALELGKQVLIIIGTANENPTVNNPFTYLERVEQFKLGFTNEHSDRLLFAPSEDWLYDYDRWKIEIIDTVKEICKDLRTSYKLRIALLGYNKDSSSFYIHDFSMWDFLEVEGVHNMSSTDIREHWYLTGDFLESNRLLPVSTDYFIQHKKMFRDRFTRLRMVFERNRVQRYGAITVAADACVFATFEDQNYILLVRRKDDKTLAFPGGFVEQNETLLAASKRELQEETNLVIHSEPTNNNPYVYDHPKRSQKGRVITNVFVWELGIILDNLPDIKGGDDAMDAIWIQPNKLTRVMMHDDHFQILQSIINQIN